MSRRGQAEGGLGAASERAFVGRPANVDVGDRTRAVEMSEPGAAGRAFPQDTGRGSRLNDRRWKKAVPGEIAPGRRARPHGLPINPTFGDGSVRSFAAPSLSAIGKLGDNPANSRRRLRTWPKLIPGSSLWTRPNTSHVALGETPFKIKADQRHGEGEETNRHGNNDALHVLSPRRLAPFQPTGGDKLHQERADCNCRNGG